jgi:hypothetical protein
MTRYLLKSRNSFWLLTIAIFVGLLVPFLVQEGMFLDGVTYSAVSKNLSHGIGSFWNPAYTQTLYPHFFEHPPLVFGIQSLFFRFLGDGFYTERVYSFLMAIITAVGIVLCWRILINKNGDEYYSWLPVLLWITIPTVFWAYKNNLLENSLSVFTTFSIYFIIRALIHKRFIWLITGAILILMAFFSKGLVGLFPLSAVVIYWFAIDRKNKANIFLYSIILIFLPLLILYLIVSFVPEAKTNLSSYFHQQLIPALNNKREVTANSHFYILAKLLIELAFPVLLLLLFIVRNRIRKNRILQSQLNPSLFFLLIGVAASFPLVISLKQRSFYLIPSIPFYILAISGILLPYLKNLLEKLSFHFLTWIKRISVLIIIISLIVSFFMAGKYSRDKERIKDIYNISKSVPDGTIFHSSRELWYDWQLVAYMNRIGCYSLDCDNERDYLLLSGLDSLNSDWMNKFYVLNLNLQHYKVLKKKTAGQK